MADELRVAHADDRVEKRKLDDFSALYNLDTSNARSLPDPNGR